VHISAYLMQAWLLGMAAVLAVLALGTALRRANWSALKASPGRLHLIAGGAVACLFLWLLNIHLVDGLILHFLGITTLTLVVGWSYAVLAATIAVVVFYAVQGLAWPGLGLSLCLTVLLPATVTRVLVQLLHRPSLKHPFVYILGAGFAGGGLVVLLLACITLVLFWFSGLDAYVAAAAEWWPLVLLIMFSEGFINGMCVSALAIFYPDWVKTFDDRFYLDGERSHRRGEASSRFDEDDSGNDDQPSDPPKND